MALSKKPFLIAFLLILGINNASAFYYQDQNTTDTLLARADKMDDIAAGIKLARQVYQRAKSSGDKIAEVKSLSTIANRYWDKGDNYNSEIYAQNALSLAKQYDLDALKGNCWITLGLISYSRSNFQQSIDHYNKALIEFTKSGQKNLLALAYMDIGVSNRKLGLYETAIENFMNAARIFENLSKRESLADTYSSIGGCFSDLDNYKSSLEYNNKALQLRQQIKNDDLISSSLNNIGFVYYRAGKPDSAINYLSRSLQMMKAGKDSDELVLTLQNLGASWAKKGQLDKGERYILRSLKIAENYKQSEEYVRGKEDLAEIYLEQKKYAQALSAINVTIDTAAKSKLLDLLQRAYMVKYNIYKQSGDYKNALLYADKASELKDIIFNAKRDRAITDKQTKYKTEEAEKDAAAFKEKSELKDKIVTQQTMYIIVLGFAAVLLAVLFIIAYKNFQKKNKANQRIQTLMRDLHHRVKNNLQILQGLFSMQIDNLSDEKTKNALRENEARLTSMNLIHSRLYLDNTTTKIEMGDYLTKLLNHIKDSFGEYGQNEVNLKIEVSNIMLEADKAVAIGLIANELTTNSFKYAFNGAGGEIHLALQLIEKSKILLTLGDNGVGLKPENKDKAPSFGLKLVNLMARQLNSTLVVKSNPGVFYQMEISI